VAYFRFMTDKNLFRQQAFIAGKWCDANSGKTAAVIDPATLKEIGHVPMMGAAETDRAIAAAEAVFPGWAGTLAKERGAFLRHWAEAMLANKDELAKIMVAECGKPFKEAQNEIDYAASFFTWFGEEARRTDGDIIPTPDKTKRIIVIKQPIGVVGSITPWNFPAAMITRKVAPAIAAGCPVVLKPALETPFSALALAALAEQAGCPPGVFSVVTGDGKTIGAAMTSNKIVRKISFTGSTPVGKLLMQQSAPTLKKLSLELGGHAPFIVFDDADLDAAVEGLIASKFRNSGQTCVCANRVFVHGKIYDAFRDKIVAAVKKLKVAPGMEEGAQVGPLINEAGFQKVVKQVEEAVSKGAKILTGGAPHELHTKLGGWFYQPTVLENIHENMLICHEETFGPVIPLIEFGTESGVIEAANNTPFGLAAYFYSSDVARCWRVYEALEYGIIGVNTGAASFAEAPFGGVKESGIGREGSKYGIEDYLEIKYGCWGI